MSIKKEQVAIADVVVGMYVCDLDRPWLETPFLMQGFLVESERDVKTLAKYCRHVYVDRSRSREDARFPHTAAGSNIREFPAKPYRSASPSRSTPQDARRRKVIELLGNRPYQPYRDAVTWRKEMSAASRAVAHVSAEVRKLLRVLSRGDSYQLLKLKQVVSPLVNSIERNPDACMWLAHMKNRDSYLYKHSVATAIWAVAFGRELGLPPRDLKSLALGGLLLDVGKLKIPGYLLRKTEALTQPERELLRSHVGHSLAALEQSSLINRDVWDMVAHHHERYDGSGYPAGMAGRDIPLFARIVGLVDSYDAMISERPYGKAMSPSFAIKALYRDRDRQFESVLVEEFIQAVGLYPAGTLVLLSSGEVAQVVAEGRTRRLKPQVVLLLDETKQAYDRRKLVNLLDALCPVTGAPLEIVQSLEPGSYGVDSQSLALDVAR